MNWLSLTIISYLMLAVVNLGDKFVVDKLLPSSKAYSFVVALFSAFVFVLAPWFLKWPGLNLLLLNLISGALFVFAIWSMYEALKRGEASRVVVVVGGIIPMFSMLFSLIIFKEKYSMSQWFGFFCLLIGMFIIGFLLSRRKKTLEFFKRLFSVFTGGYNKKWIFLAITSSLLYSLFFITTKIAYNEQDFWSAFIWIRGGGLLVVLIFLLDRGSRVEIFKSFKKKNKTSSKVGKGFVLINQALGSASFIMQNYAVFLGPVAIINALQGVQYAFLLILGIFFTIFFPKILKEDISRAVLIKKIIAILFVGLGLFFITI